MTINLARSPSLLLVAAALATASGCKDRIDGDRVTLAAVERLDIGGRSGPLRPYELRAMTSQGDSVFVALEGDLWLSRNGGHTWTRVPFGVNGFPEDHEVTYIDDIFVDGDSIYLATYPAGLVLSRDRGVHWVRYGAETPGFAPSSDVNGVWAKGALIVAATDKGLAMSRDSGATWTSADLRPDDELVKSVDWVMSDGRRLYASAHPSFHVSDDQGSTWRPAGGETTYLEAPRSLAFAGDLMFLGTWQSGLLIERRKPNGEVTDGKQVFTHYPETKNTISAIQVDGQVVILVVDGKMQVSFDRGDTWASVGGPPFSDALSSDGVTELHYDPVGKRLYFLIDGLLYRAALPAPP